jgi:N-acyl homoserine lactone hydrolase
MYFLPGGFINLDRSILLTVTDMGKSIKAAIYSVLHMHDKGPVLVDVGLNPDGLTNPEDAWGPRAKLIKPELTEGDDIRNRLRELDLDVSDIRMVLLTHLHLDHTGGLRFFNRCPIMVQTAEYRFAFHPDAFVSAQYMRNDFDHPLNFRLLEEDQIVLPGISVIKTPGHTPGHQSILVKLVSGKAYIFPGDAICLRDNLTLKIPPSNSWSSEQATDSIYRLEHLSKLMGARIIPSHDLDG